MMRRIDLLPPVYEQRRRERRNVVVVIVAALLVLLLLIGYWFLLGIQITDKRDELAEVQSQNQGIQAEIDALQRFALLEAEVQAKRLALQQVMAGDIDWPAIMTEIAMVVPGEVWLDSMTMSAGATEGSSPVGTETAPIRISDQAPVGRITFGGTSLSMPGVAKWLLRLESVKEFIAVYLGGAQSSGEAAEGGVVTYTFTNTLELSEKAVSGRFQKGIEE